MKLGIDVDAAAKLAHWGLLPHLPVLTGVAFIECFTLTSLKFRAHKSVARPDGKVFHCPEAAQAVLDFCAQAAVAPEITLMPQLQDFPGIDAGEAVLISAMDSVPGLQLLTGDKRALRSISAGPAELRQVVAGRVVIVEQVVLRALDRFGLEWLRANVCPQRHIDKAIAIVMGSRCDASEASVREALASYIGEIGSLCDPTLLAAS